VPHIFVITIYTTLNPFLAFSNTCKYANDSSYFPFLAFSHLPLSPTGLTILGLEKFQPLNSRYLKFLHYWKAYEICYITHMTIFTSKKSQIFYRYSADMVEIQTSCILIDSNFVTHPQILIFSVFKITSFPHADCKYNFYPRRWMPCWLLTNTAVTSAVTNFRYRKLIANV